MASVWKHTLALALRLSDATDGGNIEYDIRFSVNGKRRVPLPKPGGHFVFLAGDLPEEDFDLDVHASGYVPTTRRVLLEAPGIGPPLLRIDMVPREAPLGRARLRTLSGTRKGLLAIDAARLAGYACFARGFDARKRILTVYNPYRLALDRSRYALVSREALRYESFAIESHVAGEAFKTDHPFVASVSDGSPITPVVSGLVRADGTYLLRVRDESSDNRFVVRFAEEEGERFEVVDFNDPENAGLAETPRASDGKIKEEAWQQPSSRAPRTCAASERRRGC
jgi:hypothetical protein